MNDLNNKISIFCLHKGYMENGPFTVTMLFKKRMGNAIHMIF